MIWHKLFGRVRIPRSAAATSILDGQLWPAVAYLSGQVAYWQWFEPIYEQGWLALAFTAVFFVVSLLSAVCTLESWLDSAARRGLAGSQPESLSSVLPDEERQAP